MLCFALVEKAIHAQIVIDADYHRNFGTFNAFNEEKCQAHLDLSKNSIDDTTGKIIVQAAGASFPARLYIDAMLAYSSNRKNVLFRCTFFLNSPFFKSNFPYHGLTTGFVHINFPSYTATGSGLGKCRISSFCHKCSHAFYVDEKKRGSDNIVPGPSSTLSVFVFVLSLSPWAVIHSLLMFMQSFLVFRAMAAHCIRQETWISWAVIPS